MKRVLLYILALFFPWLVLLIKDDPVGALIALILQATLVGWIPASIWAIKTIKKSAHAQPKKTKQA